MKPHERLWLERFKQKQTKKQDEILNALPTTPIQEEQIFASLFSDALIESVGAGDARIDSTCGEVTVVDELPQVVKPLTWKDKEYWIANGLLPFQAEAMPELVEALAVRRVPGHQIIEQTGHGKTYVGIKLIEHLRKEYPHLYPISRPILWITPIPEQTNMDIGRIGPGLNIVAFHYAKLRTTIGKLWVKWINRIVNGVAIKWPQWIDSELLPCLIVWDESHWLKNEDSQQSMIACALAELNYGGTVVQSLCMSATPYSRPSHTRTIACLLMPHVQIGFKKCILTNKDFPSWIREMCGNRVHPNDWSPAAMKRIQDILEPHTTRFGEPEYKFSMRMRMMRINFRCAEDQAIYAAAFDDWQAKRIEAEKNPLTGFAAVLVALRKFLDTAEILRAPDYASVAHELAEEGNSVIIACKCRDTAAVVKAHLMALGHTEDQIAEIYGGQTDRAENRRAFQSDRAIFMILMFGAGGAGLSLHHFKGRNTRPRRMLMPGAWNVEEFVQVAGRAHRINSASNTLILIMWYAGTEEEKQISRVKYKAKALKEVTRRKAGWQQVTEEAPPPAIEDEEEECTEVTRPKALPPIEVEE